MKHLTTNKLALLIAAVILMSTSIFAQDVPQAKNSLTKGSWSMQFRVQDNFTLGSFNGSALSLKWHLSDKSALRFGASIVNDETEMENNSEVYMEKYEPETISQSSATAKFSDKDNLDISISAEYLYYFNPAEKVNAFLGAGPVVRLANKNDSKQNTNEKEASYREDIATAGNISSTEHDIRSGGAKMVFGLEWFVGKNISLIGEYGLSAIYHTTTITQKSAISRESETDPKNEKTTKSKDSRFSVRSQGVKFGLSVYF